MGNYEAVAYAVVALEQLQQENKEVHNITLKGRMLYLMDQYSESEIYKIYSNME